MSPKAVVQAFWDAMQTNNFDNASTFLAENYVLRYPQTGEVFRGRSDFVRLMHTFPMDTLWRFEVHRLVQENDTVVSDVSVTNGQLGGRALTFSTVAEGHITEQLEFWPEPYAVPEARRAWVELE